MHENFPELLALIHYPRPLIRLMIVWLAMILLGITTWRLSSVLSRV